MLVNWLALARYGFADEADGLGRDLERGPGAAWLPKPSSATSLI
jgi:hypothetical protein